MGGSAGEEGALGRGRGEAGRAVGGLAPRPQQAGRPSPAPECGVGRPAAFFLSARVFAAGSVSPKQRPPLGFQRSVPFRFASAASEGRGLFPEACLLCCFRKLIFH